MNNTTYASTMTFMDLSLPLISEEQHLLSRYSLCFKQNEQIRSVMKIEGGGVRGRKQNTLLGWSICLGAIGTPAVLWGERGSIWMSNEQMCPKFLIPKTQGKEYCSIKVHRDALVFYPDFTPLPLSKSKLHIYCPSLDAAEYRDPALSRGKAMTEIGPLSPSWVLLSLLLPGGDPRSTSW